MLQVKLDGQIQVPTFTGTESKPAVVDRAGKRYALLTRAEQLLAWSGDTNENAVECVLVAAFPTKTDEFLQECNAVCLGTIKEITGLRQRAIDTSFPVARMRLVAQAASVQIVPDGKELKVIPLFTRT